MTVSNLILALHKFDWSYEVEVYECEDSGVVIVNNYNGKQEGFISTETGKIEYD